MGIDGIGSSVVIAFAALLWFIYLVPTWLRRREYLSTERNAVRLQQTLRIMAETAQVPDAVRIETHARAVAAQQRALRARRAALGDTGPVEPTVTESKHAEAEPAAVHAAPRTGSSASRRLRRSRAATTFVMLSALVGAGFGVSGLSATGGWVLLAASVVVAVGALALLGQMAAVARMRRESGSVRPARARTAIYDDAEHEDERADRGWMPQPIPKPLYLNARERAAEMAATTTARPVSPHPVPAAAHANRTNEHDELLAAAAAAERALRAAHASPEVTRVSVPATATLATPPEAPNRFARMGVIDDANAEPANLDEILARRRAVG